MKKPLHFIISLAFTTLSVALSCCAPVPEFIKQEPTCSGSSQSSAIAAKALWNDTGIVLSKGMIYRVKVTGTWTDWLARCDSNGPMFPITRAIMNDIRGDLRYPPQRDPAAHFFQPIGVIGHPKVSEQSMKAFILRDGMRFTSPDSGTLFVFANDHLDAYWNNCGSLQLTITPVHVTD